MMRKPPPQATAKDAPLALRLISDAFMLLGALYLLSVLTSGPYDGSPVTVLGLAFGIGGFLILTALDLRRGRPWAWGAALAVAVFLACTLSPILVAAAALLAGVLLSPGARSHFWP